MQLFVVVSLSRVRRSCLSCSDLVPNCRHLLGRWSLRSREALATSGLQPPHLCQVLLRSRQPPRPGSLSLPVRVVRCQQSVVEGWKASPPPPASVPPTLP